MNRTFNDLALRKAELLNYMLENNVSVGFFSETYLKSYNDFYFPGYDVLRMDSPVNVHGGGIAIVVKENIVYDEIKVHSLNTIPFICAINVKVHGGPICLASIYVPNSISQIDKRDLAYIMRLGERVIIAGDFNARHTEWNCTSINKRGKSLKNYIDDQLGRVTLHVPESPTFFPSDINKQPSYIDLCISKNMSSRNSPISLPICDSDHNPIVADFYLASKFVKKSNPAFDYNKANWDAFKANLDRQLNADANIGSMSDLEDKVSTLTDAIKKSQELSIPIRNQQELQLPRFIKVMIKEKNKLRRQMQRMPSIQLKLAMKDLKQRIDRSLNCWRNETMKTKLQRLKPYDSKLFLEVNRITKSKSVIPSLLSENEVVFHSSDKAEIISNIFESVHNQNEEIGDPLHHQHVVETVENWLQEHQSSQEFTAPTINEVQNAIKETKKIRTTPLTCFSYVKFIRNSN